MMTRTPAAALALGLAAIPSLAGAQPLTNAQYEAMLEKQLDWYRQRDKDLMSEVLALEALAAKYLNMVCAPKDSPKCVKARNEIIAAAVAARPSPPPFLGAQ